MHSLDLIHFPLPSSTVPAGHVQPGIQVSGCLHCFRHESVEHVKPQLLLHSLQTNPLVQFLGEDMIQLANIQGSVWIGSPSHSRPPQSESLQVLDRLRNPVVHELEEHLDHLPH